MNTLNTFDADLENVVVEAGEIAEVKNEVVYDNNIYCGKCLQNTKYTNVGYNNGDDTTKLTCKLGHKIKISKNKKSVK